ncbi:MAG: hypothetical protein WA369_17570 [Candidatus Acidiferrales bacterium]
MKPLNKSYLRLGWVLLTNGVLAFLLLTGPVRVHHEQQLLYQAMRTTPPTLSYWQDLFAVPWVPILAIVLLVGIVAEARRSVLSPVVNLAPYVVWLIVALWERANVAAEAAPQELYFGKVLLVLPLAVVIAVDLIFYLLAFSRRQAGVGNIGPPSSV